jgi:hypothetical protein
MGQTQLFFQRFPTSMLHFYMNNMNSVIWESFLLSFLKVVCLFFGMPGSGYMFRSLYIRKKWAGVAWQGGDMVSKKIASLGGSSSIKGTRMVLG